VCNDPFDRHRELGIIQLESAFIPFETEGSTVYFNSRVPSNNELNDLARIELTSDSAWDPYSVDLSDPRPKEEENYMHVYRMTRAIAETDTMLVTISPQYIEDQLYE
jgi:hypothetical protein